MMRVKNDDGTYSRVPAKRHGRGLRWRAEIIDDSSQPQSEAFNRKDDARLWLEKQSAARVGGTYVDPKSGKTTIASFYREWSTHQVWVPGTQRAMDLAVNSVTFGNRTLLGPACVPCPGVDQSDARKAFAAQHNSHPLRQRSRSDTGSRPGPTAGSRCDGNDQTAPATKGSGSYVDPKARRQSVICCAKQTPSSLPSSPSVRLAACVLAKLRHSRLVTWTSSNARFMLSARYSEPTESKSRFVPPSTAASALCTPQAN